MLHISELAFSTDNVYSRAPNAALAPEHGSASLRAGFRPDPRTFPVQAGGDVDLSRNTASCWGHADQAPDLWVDYEANDENRLYLSMESESDTTLMVEGPNGQMFCSDDEVGLNPGYPDRPARIRPLCGLGGALFPTAPMSRRPCMCPKRVISARSIRRRSSTTPCRPITAQPN